MDKSGKIGTLQSGHIAFPPCSEVLLVRIQALILFPPCLLTFRRLPLVPQTKVLSRCLVDAILKHV